jgi:hypothetical protein
MPATFALYNPPALLAAGEKFRNATGKQRMKSIQLLRNYGYRNCRSVPLGMCAR